MCRYCMGLTSSWNAGFLGAISAQPIAVLYSSTVRLMSPTHCFVVLSHAHLKTVTSVLALLPTCDVRRRLYCELEAHERKHKSSSIKLQCGLCSNEYPDTISFKFHQRLKHQKPSFKCPDCNYNASLKTCLVGHIRTCHGNPNTGQPQHQKRGILASKAPIVLLTKISLKFE